MRLRRLDLKRYGHFTDKSFALPVREADFHIVFGPNESGKSTALAAIGDLLFGIPSRSSYNFLHDYQDMLIGAELANGSASLKVWRRKGVRDTLLRPDGVPIAGGESVLRPYLAGADRTFFERMFSLDHVRLREGGKEIIEAKDDVGQMLFSAGAGIAGLHDRLRKLSNEAEELWSARRAKHRRFYIASDKLKEAERALREQTCTASTWKRLKRACEKAEEAFNEVDKNIRETGAERNRLGRIRRVFRDVHRKQELDRQTAELGDIIELPEDAAEVIAEVARKEADASERLEQLREQLIRAGEERDKLTVDEVLIERADDIDHLYERRIEIRRGREDLPKRKAELRAAEEELRANASELNWAETGSAELMARLPPRTKVRVVRSLLSQAGKLEAKVISCTRALQESLETRSRLQEQLEAIPEPVDVSRLAMVITTVREQGDLAGQVRISENALEAKHRSVRRKLRALNPGGMDEEALATTPVPAVARIQEYRERERDWKRREREAKREEQSVRQALEREAAAFDRSVQDERIITGKELRAARSRRDALWNLVNVEHVLGESIPEAQSRDFEEELKDLAGAFESAMVRADVLADRRFDHAEEVGRISEIRRKRSEQEVLLKQKQENRIGLVEECKQLETKWTSMWAEAPFEPLGAESMLEWLKAREEALDAIEERGEAESVLETLRNEERSARNRLLRELAVVGVDVSALANDRLNMITERAAELRDRERGRAKEKAQLEQKVKTASEGVAQKQLDLQEAEEVQAEWENRWTGALNELGLERSAAPEAVEAQMDIIDQMRETAGRIRSLQHDRIDKINRDIDEFEQVVDVLAGDLAGDLLGQPAENVVQQLETRLKEARRSQELRRIATEDVKEVTAQITECQNARLERAASIAHLRAVAAVETDDALQEAIIRSDQLRSAAHEQRTIIEKLTQDGDGKTIEELVEECKGVVIDDVVAREASIQPELEDLQRRHTRAVEHRSQARDAFREIGGDDAAAQAAASKQEALTEMQEAAGRYIRVKTSSMLLEWAIDRYRREKQAPLLKRAGELFSIITGSSFSRLQVEFGAQDEVHLTGVRPNGNTVAVSGMSTGTADQLYLALRIASIEDYLERAEALPFVADDLFVNFDDERAAAGFRLLGELSRATQVVFFTHHRHLVDLASQALGGSVSMITLDDGDAATA